jgi:hypothetical protein
MSETEMSKPDEFLLDFLDSLPVTIRDNVLYMVCFNAEITEDLTVLLTVDKMETLRGFLDDDNARKACRCAQLIGIVEMALEPAWKNAQEVQELYEETQVAAIRDLALRTPLYERHQAQARARFSELRQNILSAQSLSAWHRLLSVEHLEMPGME